MAGRTRIQWRSPTFVVLRTLQVLLAIAILAIVVPKPGPNYGYPLQKRSLLFEPRRGGGSHSSSSNGGGGDDGEAGQTYARYVTPFLGMSAAALTMIWCVYALWEYLRHTLRPKISMGWDIVFMVLWLALVVCCAVGMVEADAWAHKMHYNPAQYTVFIISSVTFFIFMSSYLIGRIAHREHGPGKAVLADNEFEFLNAKTTIQSLPPQPHSPLVYSAGEERFVQVLPSPQPVYSGTQLPYAGSHYKPPHYP
ncbi:uncharacterized protein LAJ45_08497 [Morchella importuna]|uniref:MARVEL domain-containing protein n=1 Tax=Morchella conica CCBAS932 TaxID=1392247 RepID=A0A3N4KL37_9PEZI|nr:uncharacterized protein LAJ45_08497 [Morchella importuna]KAH8147341.1 hypothetical protein LAJ45_08497 [Morchella importuna]RPB11274.1 hypothetical protein P167DRAFT_606679 [Morchella conica CCBAS932]